MNIFGLVLIALSLSACQKSESIIPLEQTLPETGFSPSTGGSIVEQFSVTYASAMELLVDRYTSTCKRAPLANVSSLVREKRAELRRALWEASYCESDEDCMPVRGYFGACCEQGPAVNKEADRTRIEAISQELEQLHPTAEVEILCTADLRFPRDYTYCYRNKCL